MTGIRDWENPLVTQINRQLAYTQLRAYPDAEMALNCTHKALPDERLLSDEWKFHLTKFPTGMSEGFYQPEYDSASWAEITVTGNWQLQVFDDIPIYTNVHNPYIPNSPSCRVITLPAATGAHFFIREISPGFTL